MRKENPIVAHCLAHLTLIWIEDIPPQIEAHIIMDSIH
jgi:hypothetical protein